jgi:putative peptidoglycan lipid II flippase
MGSSARVEAAPPGPSGLPPTETGGGARAGSSESEAPRSDGCFAGVAANSMRVALWTGVSRVTGLARAIAVAAVLGPTYLGSVFQAAYVLPALLYQMLAGSLFAALLVPMLVRHVDRHDTRAVQRVASGFMTVAAVVLAAVNLLAVIASPLLLQGFAAGVADPAAAEAQRRAGLLFLVLMMPQLVLFAVAGTGAAVMNAHGRFVLAAGAPALENLGVIMLMGTTALVFGTGASGDDVPTAELLLLGVGSTGAVALHASAQWWGAAKVGTRLLPRAGWRDAEVRTILRRAIPSFGVAGLDSARQLAVLPVANRLPGGVVAFQLALNFASLPVALAAKPVATALLPQLSRRFQEGAYRLVRDEFIQGTALACFVTIPAVVAYIALAEPLSRVVSHGEMETSAGVAAVAVSLAALAPGIAGDGGFHIAAHAFYAAKDARSPLISMALRAAVSLCGIVIAALLEPGLAVLLVLGLAISSGNLVSAWHLVHRFTSWLPTGSERLGPSLLRSVAASLVMACPAYLTARGLATLVGGHLGQLIGVAAACVVGAVAFVALQAWWGSPEVRSSWSRIRLIQTGGRS